MCTLFVIGYNNSPRELTNTSIRALQFLTDMCARSFNKACMRKILIL